MPITFGSVGDIVSISLLIKDLVKCLDESRGSSAEYQAVIRELWSLDQALLEAEILLRSCKQLVEMSGLCETANRCAEQCRKLIVDFRDKTKKYQKALQGGGTGNLVRDTTAKIRWHVSEKDDLAKFRAGITAQCSSLNILLATAGVKLTMLNDERLKQSDLAHAGSSAAQTSLLLDIKARLEGAYSLLQAAASATKALGSSIDLDYFRSLGAELLSFMLKMWRINSMTYDVVVSLQARIPAQLNRSWTQEPATLEDALGRVTPFHLEFIDSWEAFESILEVRFRKRPGHRKVKRKEYALRSSFINKDVDDSIAFNRCFLPGQHYDMSMVFNAARVQNSCPACLLGTGAASDSQVKCNRCGLWYQRIVETTAHVAPVVHKIASPVRGPILKRRREEDSESDDEERQFRRVRIRCQKNRDEAKREMFESGGKMIRCICGTQDVVGMLWDTSDYLLFATANQAWLIRCVVCKVWQHRSCVGAENGNDPLGGFNCERCSKVKPIHDALNENADEYIVKCLCDSDKDDGNTVCCDRCNTWQHIECYHPDLSIAELEALDHFCADCNPRPLSTVKPSGKRRRMPQTKERPRGTNDPSDSGSWRSTTKSLTCFFWASQGYCLRDERDCQYAHHHTGKLGRPLSLPRPTN